MSYDPQVRLRVAFDGRTLTSPAGGVRRYVHELFGAMGRVSSGVAVVAVGAPTHASLPTGVMAAPAGPALPSNLGWSLTGLPIGVRRAAADVFHAPAYTAPLWGARPLVVTIHDVSYARHPEWYPSSVDPLRQAFYRASARRADRILTDSEFSKREIVAAYDIDPASIDVVPLAASALFVADPAVPREPVVLHVGDLHARRNLPMLLDVVLTLRRSVPGLGSLRLVLAGVDRGPLASLVEQAAADRDALVHVGSPSDVELLQWYRRASVFAYPSRYEGFGIPLLEAMACGTPVVASTAASIPEVAGDGALLVDVDDVDGWREAIRSLLTDRALASDRAASGAARAARFTWEATALATAAVYRRVAQEHRP